MGMMKDDLLEKLMGATTTCLLAVVPDTYEGLFEREKRNQGVRREIMEKIPAIQINSLTLMVRKGL